jgi:hypothetical protein
MLARSRSRREVSATTVRWSASLSEFRTHEAQDHLKSVAVPAAAQGPRTWEGRRERAARRLRISPTRIAIISTAPHPSCSPAQLLDSSSPPHIRGSPIQPLDRTAAPTSARQLGIMFASITTLPPLPPPRTFRSTSSSSVVDAGSRRGSFFITGNDMRIICDCQTASMLDRFYR